MSIPLQNGLRVLFLEIVYLNRGQAQQGGELSLPVNHALCYLVKVVVHTLLVPVQLFVQVRQSSGGEFGQVGGYQGRIYEER